jgi:hypothetical protein
MTKSIVLWTLYSVALTISQCNVSWAVFPISESPWPQFGIDSAGHRQSSFAGPVTLPNIKWKFSTRGLVYATPIFGAESTLYVPSFDGVLYAIAHNGELSWSYTLGGQLRGSAAFAPSGDILLLGVNGYYSFDQSGALISANSTMTGSDPSVTVTNDGTIYVGASTALYALNAAGNQLWQVPVDSRIQGTPVVGTNGDILFATGDGLLRAVSSSGVPKWSFPIPGQNVKSATIGFDGTIYAGGQSGDFIAINPDGSEKWRFKQPADVFTAAALGRNSDLIFAASDGIYSLDLNGHMNWHYADVSFAHGSVFVDSAGNIFGTRNNRVVALTASGNLLWSLALGSGDNIYNSVTIDKNGVLYIGTNDGIIALAVPEPHSLIAVATPVIVAIGCLRACFEIA